MKSRLTDLAALVAQIERAIAATDVDAFDDAAESLIATLRELRSDLEWQREVAMPMDIAARERVRMLWHMLNGGQNPSD